METVAEHLARTSRNANARQQLTKAGITELLAKKRTVTRTSKHFYFVRDDSGILIRVTGKPEASIIGKFEGRAPSKRRSRKGAVRPVANTGHRYYVRPYDGEVVMY